MGSAQDHPSRQAGERHPGQVGAVRRLPGVGRCGGEAELATCNGADPAFNPRFQDRAATRGCSRCRGRKCGDAVSVGGAAVPAEGADVSAPPQGHQQPDHGEAGRDEEVVRTQRAHPTDLAAS